MQAEGHEIRGFGHTDDTEDAAFLVQLVVIGAGFDTGAGFGTGRMQGIEIERVGGGICFGNGQLRIARLPTAPYIGCRRGSVTALSRL
ncbi:MAG: hypothetical protein M5U35_15705 [Roseovarius sp.]|nr:hypothetical protein [Roseovarius sp.]